MSKPEWHFTCENMQPPPCPGGDVVPIAPWPWRERTKTARSRRSSDHQLRQSTQPSLLPPAVQLHRGWRPFLKLTHCAREVRPTSCVGQLCPSKQVEALQPLPTSARHSPRSMSLTQTFVATRAPASLRGRTFQREPPLSQHSCLCTRCAMGPNMSSRRPHRQVRKERGRGKWRRRTVANRTWQPWTSGERFLCRSEGVMLGSGEGPSLDH